MLDSDLQHDPEIISILYSKYKEGFDIVNTIRVDNNNSSFFKRTTSKNFYKLMSWLSDTKITASSADFRLMNRQSLNALLQLKEKDRFTRGLVSWIGFNQTTIEFQVSNRFTGKSKYSFSKMFKFGLDGITSFSAKPLRISFMFGLFFVLLGIIYSFYAVISHLNGTTQPGWTSIFISVHLIGGIQLISIGIIGEYLYRVFNEVKNRPQYLIKEIISNGKKLDL